VARKKNTAGSARVIQDDARELLIAALCGLDHITDRAGADAKDSSGNFYELKSGTKSGITTARDVGLHTVDEWRKKYWIIAFGRNPDSGFEIDELYVAHPEDLEPAFTKISNRLKVDWALGKEVLDTARKCGAGDAALQKVEYLIGRGVTLNNPKIPLALVRDRAQLLPVKSPRRVQAAVKEFVAKRPLKGS